MIENYQSARLDKDGCLYCPECKHRIIMRFPITGVIERARSVRGQCTCEGPIKYDWNFRYVLERIGEVKL